MLRRLWRAADNDFPFDNTAGATGVSQREHRVNNDESRFTSRAAPLPTRGRCRHGIAH
jgi:hypothetical protein